MGLCTSDDWVNQLCVASHPDIELKIDLHESVLEPHVCGFPSVQFEEINNIYEAS